MAGEWRAPPTTPCQPLVAPLLSSIASCKRTSAIGLGATPAFARRGHTLWNIMSTIIGGEKCPRRPEDAIALAPPPATCSSSASHAHTCTAEFTASRGTTLWRSPRPTFLFAMAPSSRLGVGHLSSFGSMQPFKNYGVQSEWILNMWSARKSSSEEAIAFAKQTYSHRCVWPGPLAHGPLPPNPASTSRCHRSSCGGSPTAPLPRASCCECGVGSSARARASRTRLLAPVGVARGARVSRFFQAMPARARAWAKFGVVAQVSWGVRRRVPEQRYRSRLSVLSRAQRGDLAVCDARMHPCKRSRSTVCPGE